MQLLDATARQVMPEQAQKLLDIALRNSKRLKSLLDDILEIEKVVADQAFGQLQELNLDTIINEVVDSLSVKSEEAQIPLRILDPFPSVICKTHPGRLTRVINILLLNAIKYSNAGGEVTVSWEKLDRIARINVCNSGLPIPHQLRSHIFDPFVQGEATGVRRKQGSGLGLAIAKNLMASMGGSIDFVSNETQTRFWLDLPNS